MLTRQQYEAMENSQLESILVQVNRFGEPSGVKKTIQEIVISILESRGVIEAEANSEPKKNKPIAHHGV